MAQGTGKSKLLCHHIHLFMTTYWPTGQKNTKQTEKVDRALVEFTVVVFRVSFIASTV